MSISSSYVWQLGQLILPGNCKHTSETEHHKTNPINCVTHHFVSPTRSYSIRVLGPLISSPQQLFDISCPSYVQESLDIISQVFIDSFSLTNQKFTKVCKCILSLMEKQILGP